MRTAVVAGLLGTLGACGTVELDSATSELVTTQPPTAHLALWLDAARGVGTYPNGEVWWWEDQSGHGVVLGRGSPDAPSIRVAKFPGTGELALKFDPDLFSGDRGYLVNSRFTVVPPMTIAMVYHPLPTPDDHWDTPLGGTYAPTIALTKRVEWLPLPQTDDLAVTTGYQSSFQYLSARGGWEPRKSVAIATIDGTSSSIDVENGCVSPNPVPDPWALCGDDAGTLGGDYLHGITLSHGADRSFRGYLAEVLIYSATLEIEERQELEAYLYERYEL